MPTNIYTLRPERANGARKPKDMVAEADSRAGELSEADVEDSVRFVASTQVSSADHIAAGILRGLYEGRYVAGQKLVESELARRFGVGRGTVREALQRLAVEGVITVSLHKGANIRALNRSEVLDMLDVLEVFCGLAARSAAERLLSADDESALREIMSSLLAVAGTGDLFEFGRMRNRFYRMIVQISKNLELARLLSMLNVHLIRVQFSSAYSRSSQKERLEDYQRITDAILARDGARAERTMRQHIRGIALAIERLPGYEFDR